MNHVTFGLDSFGDISNDALGRPLSHPATIRALVEQGTLADRAGVDHFAIGEHHIPEMPISAPDVVLAAIAARTGRVRLGSAVTVLSSDDPVRVYQRYATLDAVSDGRAEVILGRGSSIESFPLYGYDLGAYERLFDEKLDLFAALRRELPVHWRGTVRAHLDGNTVYPHTAHADLPTWVGVGGTPSSVVRAADHGMHLMLAVVGSPPARFVPLAQLYRDLNRRHGNAGRLIGVHAMGHVAETDDDAVEQYWPYYRDFLPEATAQRGLPAPTWPRFLRSTGPDGSLYVGSPTTVAAKIAATIRTIGADRFSLKYGIIGLGNDHLLRAIALYGNEVIPRVRSLLTDDRVKSA